LVLVFWITLPHGFTDSQTTYLHGLPENLQHARHLLMEQTLSLSVETNFSVGPKAESSLVVLTLLMHAHLTH
jgi:hypothetical protein